MKYFFEVDGMDAGYDHKPVIRKIRIGLEKGKILTLIGPNGAGKSTVLKTIAGQLAPIGGTMFLDGSDLAGMPGKERSRKMSLVLTTRLRTELMTCRDAVETGRYPYTGQFGILSEKDRRIAQEAMELVNVTEIAGQDFNRISDGQRQRVMLARAICQEPEILILDEPTSYLDVKYKLEFLSVLQKLRRKKGLTVIMSLHELEMAERISDQILCLNGTCADRIGTPEEIFESGYLSALFGISSGSFEEQGQTMELDAVKGAPEVFVIAGNGSGRSVFRMLQRQEIPFAAGIVAKNDLDHPCAAALASEIFETEPFEAISEEILERAKRCMERCQKVICCRTRFGSLESGNRALLAYAQEQGIRIEQK